MKEVESLHRSNGVFTDSGGPGNRIERSISDSDRSDRDRDGRSSAADGAGRTAEKAVGMGRRFGARRARVVFGCPAQDPGDGVPDRTSCLGAGHHFRGSARFRRFR